MLTQRPGVITFSALLLVLGAPSAATASTLLVDPSASTIQFAGEPSARLFGALEVQAVPGSIGADAAPSLYAIQDILLEGAGREIRGPEQPSYMGLGPLLVRLSSIRVDDATFFLSANVEILETDGDRALFRIWEVRSTRPGSVHTVIEDGILVSLVADLELYEKVQWWEKVIPPDPINPSPCTPGPGQICIDPAPLPLPPYLAPREVVSEGRIAKLSVDASAPIPEPRAMALFLTGLTLVEWRRRRAGGRPLR